MRITAYADRLLDDLDAAGLARGDQAACSATGSAAREGARVASPGRRLRRDRGLHHPPGHPVRRDVHGAGPRAPAGRPDRARRAWPRGHPRRVDRRRTRRRPRRSPPTASRPPRKTDLERQTEGQGEDRRLHRRVRDQPGQRRADPGLHRRLRADGLRHRRDHGGARPRRARLGVRDAASSCRSSAPSQPPRGHGEGEAFTGDGPAINSANDEISPGRAGDRRGQGRDHRVAGGARVGEAHRQLQAARLAVQPAALLGRAVPDRLRRGRPARSRCPTSMLPVELPEVDDYSPRTFDPDDADSEPEPPLSRERRLGRRRRWTWATGRRRYRRETNTMPNWAGSCWYELRYLDPHNTERVRRPGGRASTGWAAARGRADTGGVDLYVGGAEHAVLHLLYARFWHKVLFDLGHVVEREPFHRLFNQGMIQAYAYRDARGHYRAGRRGRGARRHGVLLPGRAGHRASTGRWASSLKNAVTPDEICDEYGADTLRLYEMAMGPLDVSRPWDTRAVVGSYRFLQRLWRNVVDEETGEVTVVDEPRTRRPARAAAQGDRRGARQDMTGCAFNTAIAKLTELNNHADQGWASCPGRSPSRWCCWSRRWPRTSPRSCGAAGPPGVAGLRGVPGRRPGVLVDETVTCVVQVKGKVRARLEVARRSSARTSWRRWPWPPRQSSRRWTAGSPQGRSCGRRSWSTSSPPDGSSHPGASRASAARARESPLSSQRTLASRVRHRFQRTPGSRVVAGIQSPE